MIKPIGAYSSLDGSIVMMCQQVVANDNSLLSWYTQNRSPLLPRIRSLRNDEDAMASDDMHDRSS